MKSSVVLAAILSLLGISGVGADEPLPTDDDPPAAKPAVKDEKPADDEKLLRVLNPDAKVEIEEEIARLERAIEGMRQANKRIEADDTGAATLDLQRRVVADLEKLLENLKKEMNRRRQQQQQQSEGGQKGGRQRHSRQQLDPRNAEERQQQQQRNQSRNERQRNEDQRARDAQERLNPTKAGPAEESRRQEMVKDVWGHLPPHLREAMRNSFSEKFLPKYEDLVKRYYESLAEKSRARSEKP